jgi:hypothetical protein
MNKLTQTSKQIIFSSNIKKHINNNNWISHDHEDLSTIDVVILTLHITINVIRYLYGRDQSRKIMSWKFIMVKKHWKRRSLTKAHNILYSIKYLSIVPGTNHQYFASLDAESDNIQKSVTKLQNTGRSMNDIAWDIANLLAIINSLYLHLYISCQIIAPLRSPICQRIISFKLSSVSRCLSASVFIH